MEYSIYCMFPQLLLGTVCLYLFHDADVIIVMISIFSNKKVNTRCRSNAMGNPHFLTVIFHRISCNLVWRYPLRHSTYGIQVRFSFKCWAMETPQRRCSAHPTFCCSYGEKCAAHPSFCGQTVLTRIPSPEAVDYDSNEGTYWTKYVPHTANSCLEWTLTTLDDLVIWLQSPNLSAKALFWDKK